VGGSNNATHSEIKGETTMKEDRFLISGKKTYHCHCSSVDVVDACKHIGDDVAFWAMKIRLGHDPETLLAQQWQLDTAELQRQNAYRDLIRNVRRRA
jgi:hypothetical protein